MAVTSKLALIITLISTLALNSSCSASDRDKMKFRSPMVDIEYALTRMRERLDNEYHKSGKALFIISKDGFLIINDQNIGAAVGSAEVDSSSFILLRKNAEAEVDDQEALQLASFLAYNNILDGYRNIYHGQYFFSYGAMPADAYDDVRLVIRSVDYKSLHSLPLEDFRVLDEQGGLVLVKPVRSGKPE